jgi:uncharacterized membrane protein
MENPFSSTTNASTMRIAMFLCVVASVISAIMALIMGRDLIGTAAIITAFLIPAFGGKAVQAFAEAEQKQNTTITPIEPKL